MVLGIGEGRITVTIEKNIYASGETVRGKAILSLGQPKKARALRLDVYRYVGGGKHRRKEVAFSKDLSGERTYGTGESYDFEFLAPVAAGPLQLQQLGALGSIINSISNAVYQVHHYYVGVSLDAQMEFDIGGKAEIQVKPAQQQQ